MGRAWPGCQCDPRIGRIILAAVGKNCLPEMLIHERLQFKIRATARPIGRQRPNGAMLVHGRQFGLHVKLWDFYKELKGRLSQNQLRKACRETSSRRTSHHNGSMSIGSC